MSFLARSVSRLATNVSKRGLAVSSSLKADQMMPDPIEHATGLEKYELLAKQAGNEDPFFLKAVQRTKVRLQIFCSITLCWLHNYEYCKSRKMCYFYDNETRKTKYQKNL